MSRVLVKIARDLNVGTATIVEHLNSKGFDIENKPNAKITDGMYDELTRHFQKSIEIKDAAKNVNIGSVRPKPEVAEHPTPAKEKSGEEDSEPKSEAESESHRIKLQKPVVLGKIDLSERLKQRIEKTTPSNEQPANKRKEETPAPIEEKSIPREEVAAPVEEKRTPESAKEKPLEPQATVISTPPLSEIPTAATPEDAKTPPTTEVDAQNGNSGDNFRAETPELRGLKILGKIDTDKFERPRGKKPEKGKEQQGRGKGGNQPGGQQNRGPATQGQGGGNQPGQQNRGPANQGQGQGQGGGGNNPGGNQNRDNRGGDNRNRPNNGGQPNTPDGQNRRPQTEGGGTNPPGNALSEAEKKKRKRKRKKVTPGQEGTSGRAN